MNVMNMRLGFGDARRGMRPGDVRNDALDKKIDEAVRLLMTQDPSPQSYPAVLEAVRERPSARSEPQAGSSWVVALSASMATLLLAAVVLQALGPTATSVQAGLGSRFLIQISDTRFAHWINESESLFGYPGFLFFHTFGLAIVVGISIAVDLRLLGVAPRVPLSSVRALFPPLWVGFWMSALSGAVLFMADPARKAENLLFEVKLALVALGVMVMALIYRHLTRSGPNQVETPRGWSRVLAIASLVIWMGAIAAGRLVAYVF